jgi:hypothetical protein
MQLYASRNIHFLYIITFLDSLLEGLQEFPTLKQFLSLDTLEEIVSKSTLLCGDRTQENA